MRFFPSLRETVLCMFAGAVISIVIVAVALLPDWWGPRGRATPARHSAAYDDGTGHLWELDTTTLPIADGTGAPGRWYNTILTHRVYHASGGAAYPVRIESVPRAGRQPSLRRILGAGDQSMWSPVPIDEVLASQPMPPWGTLTAGQTIGPDAGSLEVWSAGWPFVCLQASRYRPPNAPPVSRGLLTRAARPNGPARVDQEVPVAFWTPSAAVGLTANASLFGSALWILIFAPARLRTVLRTRNGRCPRCGYPRSGLASAAPCPECAAPP